MPSRVRQAGGREHPPQALQGTLQPGFSKPQLGLRHGGPNQPPTRALRPLYTQGNCYQGLQDPVAGYLPPSRAEDKAQARGSHPGSCHSPGAQGPAGAPEHKPAGEACALDHCTPRPSRVRKAGGREHTLQALEALWEARFGGESLLTICKAAPHRGLQGGVGGPGPCGAQFWSHWTPRGSGVACP
ncbi:hypothetical protein NDU88_005424 [Pleurodeles waltl]|uniref:Uncharacterized protein n=1 Tax=Pleurodeles waltl TaxID=8319 RepID=A0AAV7VIY7_PLEWA|nr:hypothetical protein NDU88_005424 [Pleurodeles waltl]